MMTISDKYTRDTDKRFTLRIPMGTFETISWCAKKHKRSIGKEIEVAIDFYLDHLATMGWLDDSSRPEDDFFTTKDGVTNL
jgi:hypothetical protein